MKKMLRIAAAFAALFAMTNFIACSSDDDGGDDGKTALRIPTGQQRIFRKT